MVKVCDPFEAVECDANDRNFRYVFTSENHYDLRPGLSLTDLPKLAVEEG